MVISSSSKTVVPRIVVGVLPENSTVPLVPASTVPLLVQFSVTVNLLVPLIIKLPPLSMVMLWQVAVVMSTVTECPFAITTASVAVGTLPPHVVALLQAPLVFEVGGRGNDRIVDVRFG